MRGEALGEVAEALGGVVIVVVCARLEATGAPTSATQTAKAPVKAREILSIFKLQKTRTKYYAVDYAGSRRRLSVQPIGCLRFEIAACLNASVP